MVDKARAKSGAKPGGGQPGKAKRKAQRKKNHRLPGKSSSQIWLYGIHAVLAALGNPRRRILKFLATAAALQELQLTADIRNRLGAVEQVNRDEIEEVLGPDQVHQGLALLVESLDSLDLEEVLEDIDKTQPALLVVLDQVTDPHNVGAIIRSAAAFGAHAVLTSRHHAPGETGVLAKAASGAMDCVPLIHVTNIKRACKTCQDHGFWSIGLDAEAVDTLTQINLPERCLMILGAEGTGIRHGVLKNCDFVVRLPISDAMESLNVSNAGAIAMYEWTRMHGPKA